MDKVEPVANDDERELIGELGFLKEILDFFGVVEIALAANPFDLAYLASSRGGLDVLEVDFRVLAQVHNRTQVVVKTYKGV